MNGEQVSSEVITPAPIERPMEQVPPQPLPTEPKKKKKTGVVIGIVIAILVLLIGGIVLAIVLNVNKSDPVTAAMNKIMDGQMPINVSVDGDISIVANDKFSPISSVNIHLDSDLMSTSMINKTKATVTLDIRNAGEITANFDEVYAGDDDLYFKINNVNDILENPDILYLLDLLDQIPGEVDCGDDEDCQNILDEDTLLYFGSLKDAVKMIDDEWLKLSTEEMSTISDSAKSNSDISCIVNLVSDINTNSNSAIELYRKNPFIKSKQENVKLTSKNYPVYQVTIDDENFANFANSIQNSYVSGELYSCLGLKSNLKIGPDDVSEIVSEMPKIYAEINDDNNFTRIYFEADLGDSELTIIADLGFSYPSSVNVPEPEEYKDFSSVIQEIFPNVDELQD